MPQWVKRLTSIVSIGITAALAIGLLVVYGWVVVRAIDVVQEPPRLADPAPTDLPSADSSGQLPAQLRGPYDPFDRFVVIVGLVSPLLTTVVGFYFGARTGGAGREAAEQNAQAVRSAASELQARLISDKIVNEAQLRSIGQDNQFLQEQLGLPK